MIYDKVLEDLSILHQRRFEETGLRCPEISCRRLQGKTQKAVKIYNLFEKIGVDKIKYITSYSASSISELTNDKIQAIIDNYSERNDDNDSAGQNSPSANEMIRAGKEFLASLGFQIIGQTKQPKLKW